MVNGASPSENTKHVDLDLRLFIETFFYNKAFDFRLQIKKSNIVSHVREVKSSPDQKFCLGEIPVVKHDRFPVNRRVKQHNNTGCVFQITDHRFEKKVCFMHIVCSTAESNDERPFRFFGQWESSFSRFSLSHRRRHRPPSIVDVVGCCCSREAKNTTFYYFSADFAQETDRPHVFRSVRQLLAPEESSAAHKMANPKWGSIQKHHFHFYAFCVPGCTTTLSWTSDTPKRRWTPSEMQPKCWN